MKKGNEMSVLSSVMSSSTFDSLAKGSSFGLGPVKKGWFNMKKLMFAAAVAAGVVCGASAVESQVVGYSQSGLRSGAKLLTSQFANVDDEKKVNLDSLVANGEDSLYNVSLKTLDNVGRKLKEYQWVDYAGESGEEMGWYETTEGWIAGVKLTAGDALWVEGSKDVQNLQSVGAVGVKDVTVQLRSGATICGNPFPTEVFLDDILADGDDALYNVSMKTLDNVGRKLKEYQWVDYAGESGEEMGWYETTEGWIAGVKLAAGEGVWAEGSKSAQSIVFPAPEL